MKEEFRRITDENFKQIKEIMDKNFRKLSETIDSGSKKLKETLDSASEGINEKIGNNEGKRISLSENKHNRNKENIKNVEINIKSVKN